MQSLPPETPVVLSFKGPDAERYLNGQLTQSVANLGEKAFPTCITDAKGKLQYYGDILKGSETDEIWVVIPEADIDELRGRLEKYLIADDVEVADLTGKWTRIHTDSVIEGADFSRQTQGVFGDGFDCWFGPTTTKPDLESIDKDEAETLRITKGIPAWGAELESGMLPPEAGLDQNAISYGKGCYIGQEVLSRIKSVGRVNRRLARLKIHGSSGPSALTIEEKEVGRITSVAPKADDQGFYAALGYIKKAGYDSDKFHTQDGVEVELLGWA